MSATAAERTPTCLAEYPDLALAVLYPFRELTSVHIIAQHIDLAVPVVLEAEGPHRAVAIGYKMRRWDYDIALGLIFPTEQMTIDPSNQQVIIVAHVTAP